MRQKKLSKTYRETLLREAENLTTLKEQFRNNGHVISYLITIIGRSNQILDEVANYGPPGTQAHLKELITGYHNEYSTFDVLHESILVFKYISHDREEYFEIADYFEEKLEQLLIEYPLSPAENNETLQQIFDSEEEYDHLVGIKDQFVAYLVDAVKLVATRHEGANEYLRLLFDTGTDIFDESAGTSPGQKQSPKFSKGQPVAHIPFQSLVTGGFSGLTYLIDRNFSRQLLEVAKRESLSFSVVELDDDIQNICRVMACSGYLFEQAIKTVDQDFEKWNPISVPVESVRNHCELQSSTEMKGNAAMTVVVNFQSDLREAIQRYCTEALTDPAEQERNKELVNKFNQIGGMLWPNTETNPASWISVEPLKFGPGQNL